ncbi:cell division protein ZapD [Tepidiphilus sp. J10]|uniref:cell division protein ZapD n=1 Tax=Tepidiphilus sp. J10 TaxID=2502185 RepID=UPI00115DE8D7|nr:cell division protein ZapD [Tepidiphilus sp. J10]
MILFEFPFSERIRTLLRLEDVWRRWQHFLDSTHRYDHHAAIVTLFELADIAGRTDLKLDLMQELDRQRAALLALPAEQVDAQRVADLVEDIERTRAALLNMVGRVDHYLRENEWLMALRSRAHVPGGLCVFDAPAYHFWLEQPPELRTAALERWTAALQPIREGVELVLGLLRGNAERFEAIAPRGAYQRELKGTYCLLARVHVDPALQVIPTMSANKYLISLRFGPPRSDLRPSTQPLELDVPFVLELCRL